MDVYLFGELKEKIKDKKTNPGIPSKLSLEKRDDIENVYDLLDILKIDLDEISHIFINGKYCGPGKIIKSNDRIGLFPKNMALNFVEVEQNNPIRVQIKLNKELKKFDRIRELKLTIPEGSNIRFLLQKLNLDPDLEKLEIKKNGIQITNLQSVLNNEDTISIGLEL
ncbi:MAG: hypothetical protein ACQERB_17530 [Promethearchaeati archaeon]